MTSVSDLGTVHEVWTSHLGTFGHDLSVVGHNLVDTATVVRNGDEKGVAVPADQPGRPAPLRGQAVITFASLRAVKPGGLVSAAQEYGRSATSLGKDSDRYHDHVVRPIRSGHVWHGGGQSDAGVVTKVLALAFDTAAVRMRTVASLLTTLHAELTAAKADVLRVVDDATAAGYDVDRNGTITDPASSGGMFACPSTGGIDVGQGHSDEKIAHWQAKLKIAVARARRADASCSSGLAEVIGAEFVVSTTAQPGLLKRAEDANVAAYGDYVRALLLPRVLASAHRHDITADKHTEHGPPTSGATTARASGSPRSAPCPTWSHSSGCSTGHSWGTRPHGPPSPPSRPRCGNSSRPQPAQWGRAVTDMSATDGERVIRSADDLVHFYTGGGTQEEFQKASQLHGAQGHPAGEPREEIGDRVISAEPNFDEPYDPDFYRNSLWFDIWSPDGPEPFVRDRDGFIRAAQGRWGDSVSIYVGPGGIPWSLIVTVQPSGREDYEIFHAWDRRSISIAMLIEDEVAEPAAWVRSLFPDDPGGRIWIIRGDLACHADLPAGVTADQVRESWIYHENPTTDIWQPTAPEGLNLDARISREPNASSAVMLAGFLTGLRTLDESLAGVARHDR